MVYFDIALKVIKRATEPVVVKNNITYNSYEGQILGSSTPIGILSKVELTEDSFISCSKAFMTNIDIMYHPKRLAVSVVAFEYIDANASLGFVSQKVTVHGSFSKVFGDNVIADNVVGTAYLRFELRCKNEMQKPYTIRAVAYGALAEELASLAGDKFMNAIGGLKYFESDGTYKLKVKKFQLT